jgi:uncharacterized protein
MTPPNDPIPSSIRAPAHLDDDEIEQLGELLDRLAVPQGGFNMEALDGFLSALAVGPDQPPRDEWMPVVWGEQPPAFADDAERDTALRLLLGHRNACVARARFDGEELPESLSPLLWLPEDPEAEQPDELDVGSDWAQGFFTAVELRPDAWQAWLDAEEWIDEILGLLERLASGQVEPPEDAPDDAAPQPVTFKERMEIVASLPGMLADLHQYMIDAKTPKVPARRAPQPDRNALCSCGSGKKYKHCHGKP